MEQLVILAGGKGTRLKDRLGDLPKPMIPIGGKPLLEHQVELARAHGFSEVLLLVHHRADLIQQHLGDGSRWGVRIRYTVEREPLGTAGAVLAGFGKDLFPAMLARSAKLLGYNSPEFIKDIGTPQRYDHVCEQFAAGIVQRSTLAEPQQAVFLDRDGTIVKEVSAQGLHRIDQLEL